jgi:hypothetical protein
MSPVWVASDRIKYPQNPKSNIWDVLGFQRDSTAITLERTPTSDHSSFNPTISYLSMANRMRLRDILRGYIPFICLYASLFSPSKVGLLAGIPLKLAHMIHSTNSN